MSEQVGLRCSRYIKDVVANHYKVIKTLGKGGYATVYLALHKQSNQEWALKAISKQAALQNLEEVQSEVDVIETASHPNVVGMKEVIETDKNYCIVMELVTGGELFDQLAVRRTYSEKDGRDILKQVMEGLQRLHQLHFVHRDMKPENLLLSSQDENATIKLVDFGLTRRLAEGQVLHQCIGTTLYMAPEVIRCKQDTSKGYGKEADLWSLGVIAYIMLCGWAPFNAPTDEEIFELILQGEYQFPPDTYLKLSEPAKDFIRCLLTSSEKRMNIDQALQHPWITGVASEEDLGETREKLKAFQARKKLCGAINAVKAIKRISSAAIFSRTSKTKLETEKQKADVQQVYQRMQQILKENDQKQKKKEEKGPFYVSEEDRKKMNLTEAEIEDAACRFQMWDSSGTHHLSPGDFFNLMSDILQAQGKSDDSISELSSLYFASADQDKSGLIDWQEFLHIWSSFTDVK